MATTPVSLQSAVAAAATSLAAETSATQQTNEDTTVNTTVETQVENNQPEDNVLEVDATAEQIQQALEIQKTLADPVRAQAYIKQLATAAGIAITETNANVTAAQAAESVIEVLQKHLGAENADLAKLLGPALEELIAEKISKPLENLTQEQQIRQVKGEVDSTFEKLTKELPDFAKLQAEMDRLTQEISPGPKTSIESYLRQLYKLAGGKPASETSSSSTKPSLTKVVSRMVQNARETKSNVSTDVDDSRVVTSSHRPTLREAVLSAAKSLNESQK